MRRICRCEAECGEVVGDDVGHHGKVFAARCGQLQHAIHARKHLLRVPARHCHVAHSVRGFLRCELRGRAQLLGFVGELIHFLGGGAGEGLDIAHALLEVARDGDALHVGLIDLVQCRRNAGSSDGLLDRAECRDGLLAEVGRAAGGFLLLCL